MCQDFCIIYEFYYEKGQITRISNLCQFCVGPVSEILRNMSKSYSLQVSSKNISHILNQIYCFQPCKTFAQHYILVIFQIAGPSPLCVKYDRNKLITQEDVKLILDKINDRRNYIALRRSKYLPGAANMKKIVRNSIPYTVICDYLVIMYNSKNFM